MFKLPYIPSADGLIEKTFSRGRKEAKKKRAASPYIPRETRKKRAEEERVKAISGIILGDLKAVIKQFPSYDQLPPFYRELLDVRIDKDKYKKSLGAVQWCVNNTENLKNKILKKLNIQKERKQIKSPGFQRNSWDAVHPL